jgi:hypothetical protein
MLIANGFGLHVRKSYISAAIGLSITVELLNQLCRSQAAVGAEREASPERTCFDVST